MRARLELSKLKSVENVGVGQSRGLGKEATLAGLDIAAPGDGRTPRFGQHGCHGMGQRDLIFSFF
jgi:hypothetical protein